MSTNRLRYPLRNISPERISDLQEKYPEASVQIVLHGQPTKGGLGEQGFWGLIALLDWTQAGDDDAVIAPVVSALAGRSIRHVYDFKDILSQKLYLLDTMPHARHIGEEAFGQTPDKFTEDGFLFARCCAVANGREAYEQIRQYPELMPKDLDFAPLLRIANEAHRQLRGVSLHYVAAYSIETFSNKRGWEDLLQTAK